MRASRRFSKNVGNRPFFAVRGPGGPPRALPGAAPPAPGAGGAATRDAPPAFWMVPLLRAEGGEKEPQFGLVAPEDGRPTEAEAMILPPTPEEALVVDVAKGLDSGSMIEQASVLHPHAGTLLKGPHPRERKI